MVASAEEEAMKRLAAGLLVVLGLACGGVGGGGSDAAQALCGHLEKELECPCVPHGAGSTVVIDDIEVRVDAVKTWAGKFELPEIQNFDERARMKKADGQALVLEVTFTNTKPVKSEIDFVTYLLDGNGDEQFVQPYNTKLYSKDKSGWIDLWDDETLGPGKSRQAALVFPAKAGAVEGAKLILRRNEKRPDPKDPRGRMKTFTEELNVLDLGPPT
jgi:hypothetical protein